MARPNRDSPRCIDDLNSAYDVVIIGKRFSHSHEDDIVDALPAFPFDRYDLIHDFIRAQVSLPTVEPARAKLAAVGATDLSGDTNCPPIRRRSVKGRRSRDQDCLNEISIA